MVVTSELYGVRDAGRHASSDVCYSAAKLFFAYGLGNAMTFPLWIGGTAVLDDRRPTPDTTFEIIESFKPTLYFGVPTLYAALAGGARQAKPRACQSIRACVSAGEALPADIFRRWKEKTGTVILDGIGSTECLHIFIGNTLDDIGPAPAASRCRATRSRSSTRTASRCATGDSGRLWIRSSRPPNTTGTSPRRPPRPWSMAGSTPATPTARTRTATSSTDGRSDDMLKVGGIWCSPVEIESCLIAHPAVLEAAVVGHADDDPDQAEGLRRAEAGGQAAARRSTDELMALCKKTPGALQVPALGRVRARAAQDRDRQDPALQAARHARRAQTLTRARQRPAPPACSSTAKRPASSLVSFCQVPNWTMRPPSSTAT